MSADYNLRQNQRQSQSQRQVQRMSQRQIQAVNYLSMSAKDLREEILKAVSENPAIELVKDPISSSYDNDFAQSVKSTRNGTSSDSDAYMKALENNEDRPKTLQEHLIEQLNLTRLSSEEYDLCRSLIYNLDKNGCYGSMQDPESLLDKARPTQTRQMLKKCMDLIQRMDPIGTCCRTIEESLFVQAQILGDATPLTLFILDGHLDLLNPPQPDKVVRNLQRFRQSWHEKAFAKHLPIDDIDLTEVEAEEAINYITSRLNPRPAGEYVSDTSGISRNQPDIVLTVTKEKGNLVTDDFAHGKVCCDRDHYFQVKYASGDLPEIRLSPDYNFDKASVEKAKIFVSLLQFRESTLVSQGCMLVKFQNDFFRHGPDHIKPLTRKQVAQALNIHESTVSRMSAKKNSKYIQTEFGLFPVSYFYSSGLNLSSASTVEGVTSGENKVSATSVKRMMEKLLADDEVKKLSDSKLAELLLAHGIKISRRTVAKYRSQLGIDNSYNR